MGNFSLFSKKKKDKWDDNFTGLIILSLVTIFFIWKAIVESGHLFLCILCLILWVVAYYTFEYIEKKKLTKPASLWKIYSKKYPIIIQYAPPKWINPAEAWLLYNRSVEPTDLTSLIYQWKFEKLIDIKTFKWENSKRDYIKLIKLEDMPLTRPVFECEIFDSIFSMWNCKIIEWAFQLRYALMLEDLEFHWIQKWWFINWRDKKINREVESARFQFWRKNELEGLIPWKLAVFWLFLYMAIFSSIIDMLWSDDNSISFAEFLLFIIIIFVIVIWGVLFYWNMDGWWNIKYTEKWAELASQVIGYSQFIRSCDENKIKMLLKEDPLFIDRTLPYATAFGMETEFLKKISPLRKDWDAKYVRWKKASPLAWLIRFLIKHDDKSLF